MKSGDTAFHVRLFSAAFNPMFPNLFSNVPLRTVGRFLPRSPGTHHVALQREQLAFAHRHLEHAADVLQDVLEAARGLLVDEQHVFAGRRSVLPHHNPLAIHAVVQRNRVGLRGLVRVRAGVGPGLIARGLRRPSVQTARVVPQREAVGTPATRWLAALPLGHFPVASGHHSRPLHVALATDVLSAVLELIDVVQTVPAAGRVDRAHAVAEVGHLGCEVSQERFERAIIFGADGHPDTGLEGVAFLSARDDLCLHRLGAVRWPRIGLGAIARVKRRRRVVHCDRWVLRCLFAKREGVSGELEKYLVESRERHLQSSEKEHKN